jgi:nucleotide-binding universal stress UspA family protein
MTDKIIALVDGSIYSASVCEHAAWLAARAGTPVELLQELAALDEQRAKLVAHRGRAILEDARGILERAGVTEITTRLRHGDIVETVAEVEADAAMILIGKRGEAADFAKGHLGSNLERIVRASHKPVVVAASAFKPIEKVLVAYDGGVSAMKAVDEIARNPVFKGLSVHVVTVGTATPEVKKGLEDARALLEAAGTTETGVVSGQPDAALGKLVEEADFDMLVMGAYGHSRIRSLIIGSTTTAMIRSCKVPVVLMR